MSQLSHLIWSRRYLVNELDMIFQINNTTPEADTDLVGQLWPRSYELRHLSLVVSLFNLAYLESKAVIFL